MWKQLVIPFVTALLFVAEPAAAQTGVETVLAPGGGEQLHFLLFTSQNALKMPRATHTWAVMVRSVDGRIIDAQTISWLPVDLKIKPLNLFVEAGGNFPLDFTLGRMRQEHERISLWGPYEAAPELYQRFVARKAYLESGALGYQCLDFVGEAAARGNGVNCIHALTPVHGLAPGDVLQRYGDDSGAFISQTLQRRGLVVPYSTTHDWLLPALGVDGVGIVRRSGSQMPLLSR